MNNNLLSLLLRFHDGSDNWTPAAECEDAEMLRANGLLDRTPDGWYRITKRGLAVTSAAIEAARKVFDNA